MGMYKVFLIHRFMAHWHLRQISLSSRAYCSHFIGAIVLATASKTDPGGGGIGFAVHGAQSQVHLHGPEQLRR